MQSKKWKSHVELHNSQNMRKNKTEKRNNLKAGSRLLTVVQDGEVSFHSFCITHRPTEFPNLLLISSTTLRKSRFGVLTYLGGLGGALTEPLIHADACSRPESANVLHKEPKSKYFRLLRSHAIFVANTQLCHHIMKTATDNTEINDHSCCNKSLQKQMVNLSLPTSVLGNLIRKGNYSDTRTK